MDLLVPPGLSGILVAPIAAAQASGDTNDHHLMHSLDYELTDDTKHTMPEAELTDDTKHTRPDVKDDTKDYNNPQGTRPTAGTSWRLLPMTLTMLRVTLGENYGEKSMTTDDTKYAKPRVDEEPHGTEPSAMDDDTSDDMSEGSGKGLHLDDWCDGCFEVFAAPGALDCHYCHDVKRRGQEVGVCVLCRALVCYECIEAAGGNEEND